MADREHFEVFARSYGAPVDPYPAALAGPHTPPYHYQLTNDLWKAWQASHPDSQLEVAEALDALEGLEADIDGMSDCADTVRAHISALEARVAEAPDMEARADAELWRKWFPYLSRVTKRAPMAFLKDLRDYAPRAIEAKP